MLGERCSLILAAVDPGKLLNHPFLLLGAVCWLVVLPSTCDNTAWATGQFWWWFVLLGWLQLFWLLALARLILPGSLLVLGLFVGNSTMWSSVTLWSLPSRTYFPWIGSCGVDGLNTVALYPWNNAAGSPLQSLFMDNNDVLTSSCLSTQRLMDGMCCSANSSVADAVIILSYATCALVASARDACWWLEPIWVVGKQLADASESSASWMMHCFAVVLAGLNPNMTRLVDFTWKAVLVFEMETGVSVDMLDRVESDNPTVEMMCGGDCGQICSHAFLSVSQFWDAHLWCPANVHQLQTFLWTWVARHVHWVHLGEQSCNLWKDVIAASSWFAVQNWRKIFYLFFELMIIDFLSSLLTILSCEMVFNWFLQCLLLNPCIWVNCSDLIMGWSWFILVWSWKLFRFHDGTRSRPDQDQLQLEGSLCICSCFQTQPSHAMLQLKSNHDLDNLTGVLGFQRCTPES